MKKIKVLLPICLSLAIALSGCAADTKVSEINLENEPVSRSLSVEEPKKEVSSVQTSEKPSSDAPSSMRKFLNYNGYRYAFVEDGKLFDFSSLSLDNPLGTLEHDIIAGMSSGESVADKEFSSSFAVGGTLYAHPDYDPAFRLIVNLDDQYYLAELVGKTDNTPLEADYFFEHSKLISAVSEGAILNHIGNQTLVSLEKNDAKQMLTLISQSEIAELSSEDYQQIASEQSDGNSYQLSFAFPDKTFYSMYILPNLDLVSIGDDYYRLPEDFSAAYTDLFSSLPKETPPMN